MWSASECLCRTLQKQRQHRFVLPTPSYSLPAPVYYAHPCWVSTIGGRGKVQEREGTVWQEAFLSKPGKQHAVLQQEGKT